MAAKPVAAARRLGSTEAETRALIQQFLDAKLMVEMDGQVLSLAVFQDRVTEPSEGGQQAGAGELVHMLPGG